MFKFLKEKLSEALHKFSRNVDEASETVEEEPRAPEGIPLPEEKELEQELAEGEREEHEEEEKEAPDEEPLEPGPAVEQGRGDRESKERETPAEPIGGQAPPPEPEPIIGEDLAGPESAMTGEPKEEKAPEPPPMNLPPEPLPDHTLPPLPDLAEPPKEEKGRKGFFSRITKAFRKREEKREEALPEIEPLPELEPLPEELMREEPPKASAPGKEKERETRLPVRPVPAPAPEKEQKGPEPKRERPSIIREEPKKEEEDEERKEKRSFFSAISDTITKKAISDDQFENMFWDLEMALMESNVAMEVIGVIKRDLKERLVMTKVRRGQTARIIQESLRQSIETMLANESPDLYTMIAERRKKEPDAPFVVLFVGVNGSGKTTNLAKVAHYLKGKGLGVVLAACDTFRAAAIQQLELHGENLGLKVIRHDYGSDAAAVAFDAIGHAKAKRKDVVLIDSAGRSHANTNLMDELKKLAKVAKPDLTVFVGDSLTGNDAVEQAKTFDAAVGVDAVILAKLDVDEKGGAAISVSQVTKKPILFVGTGQSYEDIRPFHPGIILESLGLDGAA